MLVNQLLGRLLWRLSHHDTAHGFQLAWALDRASLPTAKRRLKEALDLIARTWPLWPRRARRYFARIQVVQDAGYLGAWNGHLKSIELNNWELSRDTVPLALIAATLIHEATHARIAAKGIRYNEETSIRIERACVAQQIAFVSDLPQSPETENLRAYYEDMRKHTDIHWSPEARDDEALATLRRMRFPAPVASLIMRVRRWHRHNKRVGRSA